MPETHLNFPSPSQRRLGLRVGDVVEVRSREEILATLSEEGRLDNMPFMPEMLAFCGRRLTVEKRAHKTCDTVEWSGLRQLNDTVHLTGSRCSGTAHGGCEASCTLFWKEAWLKRVDDDRSPAETEPTRCTEERLHSATRKAAVDGDPEVRYSCQATELREYTRPLSVWDIRQYIRDIQSGNVTAKDTIRGIAWRIFRWSNTHLRGWRAQQWLFNHMQRMRGGMPNMILQGDKTKTPRELLHLVPGEQVEVKSIQSIVDTLNKEQRNRGLYFDKEMTPWCERRFRVKSRVTKIIEEKTGKMMPLPGDCLILEGAVCTGRYHGNCPRMIPSYWREIWLRRTDAAPAHKSDPSV